MKAPVVITALTLAVALSASTCRAQEFELNKTVPSVQLSPFVSTYADVAPGTSVTYAAAYPVLGDGVFPLFAHAGIGFSSVLELPTPTKAILQTYSE